MIITTKDIKLTMKLPTLFARTHTGAVQSWIIEVESDSYRTEYGQVNGKIQQTAWTKCFITNEGRANQRNPEEQALFEAQALWKKKKESGYYESVKDIDKSAFFEPMLAKKYDDYRDEIIFPVFSQPKLDGLRCIVTKEGMFSRNGKRYVSCPHIRQQLNNFFEQNPDAVLDGELYNHDLKHDFNKITSLVKKTKPTPADLAETASMVEYWIYDIALPGASFKERITVIEDNFCKGFEFNIKVVPTAEVTAQDKLDELYSVYLDAGFEGQMVRINAKYENKRTKSLLKRKEFQDSEYTILAIVEGEGNKTGMAGAMVFRNELGHEFNANIKGTREFITEIWQNKDSYIGKLATVSYFNLTPDKQVPRFPYVIKIRESFDL